MPRKRFEKSQKAYSKARCDSCNKLMRIRHLVQFKGKFLCRCCRNKLPTFRIQMSASQYLNKTNYKTIEQVLNKVYEVKSYTDKRGYRRSFVQSLPKCMEGRHFKIILVEDEN